jgi:NAD(P)-dependent dehydrogenase (short-subunit alcohol dehydrogenase family)
VQFEGKIVAVTGAAGGIGRELCRLFGAEGATIAAIDRNEAVNGFAAELKASGVKAEAAVADVEDAASVEAAFAALIASLGRIDVLVNNAGGARAEDLAETTPENFVADVDLNLNGPFYCCNAVLPGMKARKAGVIVNISSVNGLGALGNPAYSAAKAGLISLTRSLAVELGGYGTRANAICPGTVRTPVWQRRVEKNPQVFTTLSKWYPLGRVVEPVEVARTAVFLASDAASAITGVALPVDCGLMAGNGTMTRELIVAH